MSSWAVSEMRIAIVGAGIAGLATAVGLNRLGIEVSIYERSDGAAPGAGISLFGNGLTALAALGLADRVRALGAPPDLPAGLRTPDGRWLQRTATDGVDLVVVHRTDLQQILVAAAPPVRQDAVTRATGTADGAAVELASGTRRIFDLVIGADGVGSRTRADLPGDPGVRYAGYTAWRGITDGPLSVSMAGETWGRGERFGIAPLSDGRVYWFAVASVPRDWRVPDEHAEVVRRFGGWHAPIPALLAATSPETVLRNDIIDLAGPLDTFVHGRLVLAGDAAHAMTPNLGQGGNQALEDAATLVALVGRSAGRTGTELDAALADYDRMRRPRTQRMARAAWRLGRLAQADGTVNAGVRDAVLRLVPARVVARLAARTQAWQPPG